MMNTNNPDTITDSFSPEQQKIILQHLMITKNLNSSVKNYSHVPCKFFKSGQCQAGAHCKFSHQANILNSANLIPCKYFKKGHCKFGDNCVNSHVLNSNNKNDSTLTSSNVNVSSSNNNEGSSPISNEHQNLTNNDFSVSQNYQLQENVDEFSRRRAYSLSTTRSSTLNNFGTNMSTTNSTSNSIPFSSSSTAASFSTPVSSVSSSNSWQKSSFFDSNYKNTALNMTPFQMNQNYNTSKPPTPGSYSNYFIERYPRRLSNNNIGYQIAEEHEEDKNSSLNMNQNYQYNNSLSPLLSQNTLFQNINTSPATNMNLNSNTTLNSNNIPISPTAQYSSTSNDYYSQNHNFPLEDTQFFFDDF